jgi:D-glycero-D-manno-heptose 1,7-bisphosphate phosphatase
MPNFDTLFLDRDGVINKKLEGRYVRNFSEFEFMPGALEAISKLSNVFSRILIVTNQQGIAKGIMSEADLNTLHTKMQERIEKLGGKINKIYYCPHLQIMNCMCRKPNSGMIEQAIIDFPEISVKNSYLIGDSDSDIKAGKRMNLNTVKVNNNYTLAKWTTDMLRVL